jgi:hypothetical protein
MTLIREIPVDNKLAHRPVAMLTFGTIENSDINIYTACRNPEVEVYFVRDM